MKHLFQVKIREYHSDEWDDGLESWMLIEASDAEEAATLATEEYDQMEDPTIAQGLDTAVAEVRDPKNGVISVFKIRGWYRPVYSAVKMD